MSGSSVPGKKQNSIQMAYTRQRRPSLMRVLMKPIVHHLWTNRTTDEIHRLPSVRY